MKKIFENVVFDKVESTASYSDEYNNCTFKNCDFSNVNFDFAELIDCLFLSCNLTMAKLGNTTLSRVKFDSCKLLGVDFSKCSKFLFSISFENSMLNYSLFSRNDLKNTLFNNCKLNEVSFIETNLTSAKFLNCDLEKAIFDRTNLEKADFSTSQNYTINPELNKLKKTKFSMPDVIGLLHNLDIIITE